MKAYIEILIDYNYWANGLILKNVEKLSSEQFLEEVGLFKTNLQKILSHTMFAEWIWLDRMQGKIMAREEMQAFFTSEKYPDVQKVYQDWFDLELRMRAFLGDLTEDQLTSKFKFRRSDGESVEYRYVDIFTQLAFHGMQHRSECAVILTEMGHSPGNLDYIVYVRS
jgi:uncharacterized damage-inducible protein DinB